MLFAPQSHTDNTFDFQDDSRRKKDTKYKDQIAQSYIHQAMEDTNPLKDH